MTCSQDSRVGMEVSLLQALCLGRAVGAACGARTRAEGLDPFPVGQCEPRAQQRGQRV